MTDEARLETEALYERMAGLSIRDHLSDDVLCLEDGWCVVWAVQRDGSRILALWSPEGDAAQQGSIADASHEQVGELPRSWLRRVKGDPRCGAATRAGAPCRRKVDEPGDRCSQHRRTR